MFEFILPRSVSKAVKVMGTAINSELDDMVANQAAKNNQADVRRNIKADEINTKFNQWLADKSVSLAENKLDKAHQALADDMLKRFSSTEE